MLFARVIGLVSVTALSAASFTCVNLLRGLRVNQISICDLPPESGITRIDTVLCHRIGEHASPVHG